MKSFLPVLFLLASVACSNSETKNIYNPDLYLSRQQQQDIIEKTIRYSTKLAPNANHDNKFDQQFDWYYDRSVKEYDLNAYYIAPDSTNYFLMTRQARSITPMREAIGGKIRINKAGEVVLYDEIFRTWKMPQDTLDKRSMFLFERLVYGRDLTLYYSKYQGDKYIEFPDDNIKFNRNLRRWENVELDSVMTR